MSLIKLDVPVARDEDGYWSNPAIPDFDEDFDAYRAWLKAQYIETKHAMLESEKDGHPAYIAYYENDEPGCQLWNDQPPAGEGWHTFSIHDSEDGPCWVWARRVGGALWQTSNFKDKP